MRLCWHFGPDVTVTEARGRYRLRSPGGRTLHLHVEGPTLKPTIVRQEGLMKPGPGAISPEYNTLMPAPSLIFEGEVPLPARWETRFEVE